MRNLPGRYLKSTVILFVLESFKLYVVTHLLYMDDIKLFAQNDAGLQKMEDLVRKFSDDIRMSFGISKCAKITVKQGKLRLYQLALY